MKSQAKAYQTFKNLCNKSTSKCQYSFGRGQRFRQHIKDQLLDKFYDVPTKDMRNINAPVFTRALRDCQKDNTKEGPAPDRYHIKSLPKKDSITLAVGRDVSVC